MADTKQQPVKQKKLLKPTSQAFDPLKQQQVEETKPTNLATIPEKETVKPAENVEQPQKQKKSLKLKNTEQTNGEIHDQKEQHKDIEFQVTQAPPAENHKAEEKVKQVEQQVAPQPQPAKPVITFEVISYFLDKDLTFEVEDDERKTFDKRLITFINRKYEQSSSKDYVSRNNNRNQTSKVNGSYNNNKPYAKQGTNVPNSFPAEGGITRNDSKRYTQPALVKGNSSNQQISRQKEDIDIIEFKMKLKKNASQFTEHAKTLRADEFKKQISEIRLDLNILTPTNFEVIRKKLFDLAMTNENLCEYVVEGIIEKARTERTYSQVYADLCKYMIDQSKKLPTEAQQKMFKSHLYTNIQQTFEGEKDIFNNKMTFAKQKKLEDMQSDDEKKQYFADKKKREMLNVKFIGNLFLNKSMNFSIQTICCSELLKRFIKGYCEVSDEQRDKEQVEEAHYEDHLEALIALFEQTGQKMEEKYIELNKKNNQSSQTSSILNSVISLIDQRKVNEILENIETLSFEDYFTIFEWLKKNKKISPRIYSLITNLLERKSESWKERLSTQTGPQSLQNLHKKHEEEMKQNQIELQKYEQKQKQGGNHKDRGYQRKDDKKRQTVNNSQANGKLDEKAGIVRAKEFWGYLDAKVKIQEDYGVANAVNDLKQLKEEVIDPVVFGEVLIKTVYDCNKVHKDDRMQVAKEVSALITPEQFFKAFNDRLNKSKDESSDFPLFLEFLSELFVHHYNQSLIQFSQLKINYKPDYDEYDQEDLNFVYMQFFEECIKLLKKQESFNAPEFIKSQIDPVLKGKDNRYDDWVKDNSK
ncbi:hypothetical protein ABPG74_008032 [Tetrahymena malaccensis]